jgi:hypothetical protein
MVTPALMQDLAQDQALEALADLQVPAPPEAMSTLLRHVFAHLGLGGDALQVALRDSRLPLSGIDLALAADPGGEVLVAAADLGGQCAASLEGKRRALRANALLMLHACIGVAQGLGGPGSTQLIGRLRTPGRPASEVAHWLGSFAGLARSIRHAAPEPADRSPP